MHIRIIKIINYSTYINYSIYMYIKISECACPMYSETTPVKRQKTSSAENPRHFLIHLLLKHPEGLWDRTESAENSIHWKRCTEYFNFLYQLLYYLQGIGSVLAMLINTCTVYVYGSCYSKCTISIHPLLQNMSKLVYPLMSTR
jgi:hypothetical protein